MNCENCKNPIKENSFDCEWCGTIVIKKKQNTSIQYIETLEEYNLMFQNTSTENRSIENNTIENAICLQNHGPFEVGNTINTDCRNCHVHLNVNCYGSYKCKSCSVVAFFGKTNLKCPHCKLINAIYPGQYNSRFISCGGCKKNFKNPNVKGCFIATACFGDYNSSEVIILRKYRDEVLSKYLVGRYFISFYYRISPEIADLISHSQIAKKIVRKYLLMPLISILNNR